MEKIFKTLTVVCALLYFGFWNLSASASCPIANLGSRTGSACSVKEINNLEQNRTENVMFNSQSRNAEGQNARNLRPVRLDFQGGGIQKTGIDDCVFGMCLQKRLFAK